MNNKLLLILIFLFSAVCIHAESQPSVDSLKKELQKAGGRDRAWIQLQIAKTYEDIPPQERIDLSIDALKYGETQNDNKIISNALKSIGIGYYYQANYKKAGEYFKMALDIFKKTNDTRNINAMLNNLALINQFTDNFYAAINYYKEALANDEKSKDSAAMSKALTNITTLYLAWDMGDEAMEFLKRAKELNDKLHDTGGTYSLDINYAKMALMKGMKFEGINDQTLMASRTKWLVNKDSSLPYFETAKQYAFKALNLDPKYKTHNEDQSLVNMIAHVMLFTRQIDSASYYSEIALKLAEKSKSLYDLASAYYLKGRILFELNNPKEAERYFLMSYEEAKEQGNLGIITQSADYLRNIYLKTNNSKKALQYANELLMWKDSLFTYNNTKVFGELKGKVEYERQQKEILEKRSRILQLEKENTKQSNMRNLLVLLSITLLLVAAAYYSRYQIKSNMHEKLAEANAELSIANEKLKESEENMRQANSTKDKFLSIISHDLKNSVGSFKNITELLSQNYNELDDYEKIDFLNIMQASSKNLYTMLENLLSWARSQSGKIRTRFESFPIRDLITAEINFISLQANSKNIKIEVHSASDVYVFADYNMISTVLRNLITNAVKFTPNNGHVHVQAIELDDFVQIKVEDTGIGIPFDSQKRLFKIDESFSTRGTSNETGTGLGLVLCKEFIERNNGSIVFESVPEQGTTFIITLPKTHMHEVIKKVT